MSRSSEIMDVGEKLGCLQLALEHIQRNTTASEFRALALERMRNNMRGFSFGAAIRSAIYDPQSIDGFERECLKEWGGGDFDHRRWHIPWSAMVHRDLNVASASAGGFLTDSRNLKPRDILRPYSVTAKSGLEIVSGVSSSAMLPATTGKSTIHWLPDEATAASESTPTIGQTLGAPKIAIGLIEFSRNFAKQTDFESWIRRELLRTAGTAIDQGVINGSGSSGEMEGLLNVSGIGTEAGGSFAHATSLAIKRKVADADVDDESITFLAPPATRELLEQREVIADTGEFVWQADQVADRDARVSTDIPAATLIGGSWQTAMLLLWGNGIEIEFNPFDSTKFRQGIVQARVLVASDVLFPTPAAFCVSTAVT